MGRLEVGMVTRWNCLVRRDWMCIRFYWWFVLHPIAAFKRWMWTRCAGCGGSFKFANWPTFDGTEEECDRAGWFKGESRTYHSDCHYRLKVQPAPAEGEDQ